MHFRRYNSADYLLQHCVPHWFLNVASFIVVHGSISQIIHPHLFFSFQNFRTPWRYIWTSPAVWAVIVAHFCNNWGFYTFLTCLPSYFKEVLNFPISKVSLPYLIIFSCLSFNSSSSSSCSGSRPPSVDIHHGYCALGVHGVATRAAASVAGKTNAGVAVSTAQSADVVSHGGCQCPCTFHLTLLSSARFRILASPVFSSFNNVSHSTKWKLCKSYREMLLTRENSISRTVYMIYMNVKYTCAGTSDFLAFTLLSPGSHSSLDHTIITLVWRIWYWIHL